MTPAAPIRVAARVRSRAELDAAPAKLVTSLLSVAAAGLVEAGRFRRGREYAQDGSVGELVVCAGELQGLVHGSRREPYEVVVSTSTVPRPRAVTLDRQQLAALTPDGDDLAVRCTCPDAEERPCKHATAVLLAFAAEAGDRPDLLVAWRCVEADVATGPRATIGSRTRTPPARPAPATSPFATAEWRAFFAFAGDGSGPAEVVAPPMSLPVAGVERVGELDVGALARSAQAAMRSVRDIF